ncbi:MAG: transglutaminase family protein, partial [Planctomycetaceae bacterium]|nr:transglutaminase family protein [Planctomycetaceae bacterium]
ALEAESRRTNRFFKLGHTGGKVAIPPEERNDDYPMTLDLRRAVERAYSV